MKTTKAKPVTAKPAMAVAVREAAQIVMASKLFFKRFSPALLDRGKPLTGWVPIGGPGDPVQAFINRLDELRKDSSQDDGFPVALEGLVLLLLVGEAASSDYSRLRPYTGKRPQNYFDLYQYAWIAAAMLVETQWRVSPVSSRDALAGRFLDFMEGLALSKVRQHRADIRAVAKELLKRGTLTYPQVKRLLRARGPGRAPVRKATPRKRVTAKRSKRAA